MRGNIGCAAMLLAVAWCCEADAAIVAYSIGTNGNDLYRIDLATGAAAKVGNLGVSRDWEALAFDPTTGILYAAGDMNGLWTVSTSTGAATYVGYMQANNYNSGITFSPDGTLYLVARGTDHAGRLWTVDKSTAVASLIGETTPPFSSAAYIGGTIFSIPDRAPDLDASKLYRVDPTSGTTTGVGNLGYWARWQTGLTYDPSTSTLYAISDYDDRIYTVDTSTGAASFLSSVEPMYTFECLAINPIPEPSPLIIWSLLGALGIAVGWWRRRR